MKNPALDPARLPNETPEQYRARRKANNAAVERHLKGYRAKTVFKKKALTNV